MPTSSNISGVSREHTSWPVTISGAKRESSSMLAGIGGIQREIFSGMYVWERYSILKSVQYHASSGMLSCYLEGDDEDKHVYYARGRYETYRVLNRQSTPTLYYNTIYDYYRLEFSGKPSSAPSFDDQDETYCSLSDGDIFDSSLENTGSTVGSGRSHGTHAFVASGQFSVPNGVAEGNVVYIYYKGEWLIADSKGAFVDQVESKSPNAYPVNGVSGGFWYVKIK